MPKHCKSACPLNGSRSKSNLTNLLPLLTQANDSGSNKSPHSFSDIFTRGQTAVSSNGKPNFSPPAKALKLPKLKGPGCNTLRSQSVSHVPEPSCLHPINSQAKNSYGSCCSEEKDPSMCSLMLADFLLNTAAQLNKNRNAKKPKKFDQRRSSKTPKSGSTIPRESHSETERSSPGTSDLAEEQETESTSRTTLEEEKDFVSDADNVQPQHPASAQKEFEEKQVKKEDNPRIEDIQVNKRGITSAVHLLPEEPSVLTEDDSLLPEEPSILTEDDSLLPEEPSVLTEDDSLLPEEPSVLTEDDSRREERKKADTVPNGHRSFRAGGSKEKKSTSEMPIDQSGHLKQAEAEQTSRQINTASSSTMSKASSTISKASSKSLHEQMTTSSGSESSGLSTSHASNILAEEQKESGELPPILSKASLVEDLNLRIKEIVSKKDLVGGDRSRVRFSREFDQPQLDHLQPHPFVHTVTSGSVSKLSSFGKLTTPKSSKTMAQKQKGSLKKLHTIPLTTPRTARSFSRSFSSRLSVGHPFSSAISSHRELEVGMSRSKRRDSLYLAKRRLSERPRSSASKDIQNHRLLEYVQSLVRKRDHDVVRAKWTKMVHFLTTAAYIARKISIRSYEMSASYPIFIDIGDYASTDPDEDQRSFIDSKLYKAGHGEFNLNLDERQVLMSAPEERTEKDLFIVLHSLQFIDSFCDYPLSTQRMIAKTAMYNFIQRRRVILRQGQVPLFVYFILSGQAVVTEMSVNEKGESFRQTCNLLNKGELFGHLAIIDKIKRTSTVTSRTDMQVLQISKEDYINIFMPERCSDGIPDFIKYLSELSWMKNWPVEMLVNNPTKCNLRYFRHRHVIVKDSTSSENLYIVRSGRCQVLMMIDQLKTNITNVEELVKKEFVKFSRDHFLSRTQRITTDFLEQEENQKVKEITLRRALSIRKHGIFESRSTFSTTNFIKQATSQLLPQVVVSKSAEKFQLSSGSVKLPRAPLVTSGSLTGARIDTVLELFESPLVAHAARSPHESVSSKGIGKHSVSFSIERIKRRRRRTKGSVGSVRLDSLTGSDEHLDLNINKSSSSTLVSSSDHSKTSLESKRSKFRASMQFTECDSDHVVSSSPSEPKKSRSDHATVTVTYAEPLSSWERRRRYHVPKKCLPKVDSRYLGRGNVPQISSWDRRRKYKIPPKCLPKVDRTEIVPGSSAGKTSSPVFAEVKILGEGDVFGFDQLHMPMCIKIKTHKVSLVSSGAEVIVLNKNFFLRHASAEVQQAVFFMTEGYPSPEEVRHTCRLKEAYEIYMKKVTDDICHQLQQKRPKPGLYFNQCPPINPFASVGIIPDTS